MILSIRMSFTQCAYSRIEFKIASKQALIIGASARAFLFPQEIFSSHGKRVANERSARVLAKIVSARQSQILADTKQTSRQLSSNFLAGEEKGVLQR